MKINWKLRLQNKQTVLALVSALFALTQGVFSVFGVDRDFYMLQEKVIYVVTCIFAVLGILSDPTTEGLSDSDRALSRENLGED